MELVLLLQVIFQRIALFQVNNNNNAKNFLISNFIFVMKVVIAGMWILAFILQL